MKMKKILSVLISAAIAAAVLCACRAERNILPERVTVYLKDSGTIVTEDYADFITGCVFGWLPPTCEREAIKSAACALSSLALRRMADRSGFENSGADITAETDGEFPYMTDEQISEEYGSSAERYMKKVRECTQQAICCAITYNNEPIGAVMCRISSGMTDSGALPFLNGVSMKCDESAEGYESTCALTPLAVKKALASVEGYCGSPHLSGNGAGWFSDPEYADSGTLKSVKFGGVEFTGKQLKDALELRSAAITVSFEQDKFLFTCRGWGDNTGMSLSCAQSLALQGMEMADILGYFYAGAELTTIG